MNNVQSIMKKFRAEHLTTKPKAKAQILRPPKQKYSHGDFSKAAIDHRKMLGDKQIATEKRKEDDKQIEDLKVQGIAKAETTRKASLESLELDCFTRDFGHPRTFQAKKVGHNVPSVKDQTRQHEFLIEQADKKREAYKADGIARINEVYEGQKIQFPHENLQEFLAQNDRAAVQRNHIANGELERHTANLSDRDMMLKIAAKLEMTADDFK